MVTVRAAAAPHACPWHCWRWQLMHGVRAGGSRVWPYLVPMHSLKSKGTQSLRPETRFGRWSRPSLPVCHHSHSVVQQSVQLVCIFLPACRRLCTGLLSLLSTRLQSAADTLLTVCHVGEHLADVGRRIASPPACLSEPAQPQNAMRRGARAHIEGPTLRLRVIHRLSP